MSSRYGTTRAELDALLAAWGEPRYRAGQVWRALYRERRPLGSATTLPRGLRERLEAALPLALHEQIVQRAPTASPRSGCSPPPVEPTSRPC